MNDIEELFHDTVERMRELNEERKTLARAESVEDVVRLADLTARIDELGSIILKIVMSRLDQPMTEGDNDAGLLSH